MKLPDFLGNVQFNRLRQQMGAKLISWKPIDQLLNTEGIQVEPEKIKISDDGTLEYEGRKVVVYIRDQFRLRNSDSSNDPQQLYKFHIVDCLTLQQMKRQGRHKRYVVATRTDGKFYVNFLEGGKLIEKGVECKLYVCKHCLNRLNYKKYRSYGNPGRNRIREFFKLKEFFERYGSQITRKPGHDDTTAPVNQYPSDWDQKISPRYKEKIGWKCEECGIDLGENTKFLHVHHINGLKYESRDDNLRALCIGCHAEQFQHQHMKAHQDYKDFQHWRASLNSTNP